MASGVESSQIIFIDENLIPNVVENRSTNEDDFSTSEERSESETETFSDSSDEEVDDDDTNGPKGRRKRRQNKRLQVEEKKLCDMVDNVSSVFDNKKIVERLKEKIVECQDERGLDIYKQCSDKIPSLISLMATNLRIKCIEIIRKKEIKKVDKKAELCVSWARYLDCFKPGRNSKEREQIVDLNLKSFSAAEIHNFITLTS